MPNWEAYQEAYNRGILPENKKVLFEEAQKRGLVPQMEQQRVPIQSGMTPQQSMEATHQDQGYGTPPQRLTPFQPTSAVPESTMGRFMAGMGGGMVHLAEGAKQRGLEVGQKLGLVEPETVQKYQEELDYLRKVDQPLMDTTAGKVGEVAGQIAPLVAIPGGVAGGLATRLGTGILAGAATGALQPTTSDESPILNTAIGGAGGALGVGGAASLSKGANIVTGKGKDILQQVADKYNIRVTLGEITRNPIVQKMETWLEGVPIIGLKNFRQKQLVESENAAKHFVSKYVIDPNAPDAMAANRAYAGSLYKDLTNLVESIPDQQIQPGETRVVAKELLDRYPDLFKKFQDAKRESLIKNVVSDTPEWTTGSSRASSQIPNTITFEDAWALRDGLGEMIGQARRKLVSGDVDQTTLGQMKHLFRAINNDIDNWANSINRPDVRTAVNTANDAYKTYVVKYDVIQRAMDKAQGTVGAGEMFSPKKFSTTLKEIAYKDRSLNRFKPQEIEEMTGLANIMQVVKRAGQFAENPPTGNRWGLPVIAASLGTYALQGTPAGMAAAGGLLGATGLSRFLTGTKLGKSLILTASKIEPDSPQMAKVMEKIYQNIPKISALQANEQLKED